MPIEGWAWGGGGCRRLAEHQEVGDLLGVWGVNCELNIPLWRNSPFKHTLLVDRTFALAHVHLQRLIASWESHLLILCMPPPLKGIWFCYSYYSLLMLISILFYFNKYKVYDKSHFQNTTIDTTHYEVVRFAKDMISNR